MQSCLREGSVLREDEDVARSASYWEEVDQEEIERARRWILYALINTIPFHQNTRSYGGICW